MKVLVLGATGFVGGGIARALQAAGHEVAAVARTDAAERRLRARGYAVVRGDVAQPQSLIDAARRADATVYCVQLSIAEAPEIEAAALRAFAAALETSNKTLLYTSGVWYYGPAPEPVDETAPPNPPPFVAARPRLERIVLDGTSRGIRAIVVRPGDVYGEGKGLPALFVASARENGAARTFGEGANHWPVVHVDDLGRLFAAALERGQPGDVFNATDETSFTQLDIARAASRGAGAGGATAVWAIADAAAAMGPWVAALAMDQRVSSARARRRLGWEPRELTILEDLERGSYAGASASRPAAFEET
ncbi:MAG TPA: NAD-dependent epimerase/dehydratase family protein [Candidatus Acidoferrales bacterium]|nr:NAD-dependent epimerase/dehydratase family protein [Candidatus Acidoferrales bacterium]